MSERSYQQDLSDLTETAFLKPTPLLEEEIRNILISMGQTVQEFGIHVKVGDTVRIIDGAFTVIIQVKLPRLTIIRLRYISMFGNDTIAEANLNQIAELQ